MSKKPVCFKHNFAFGDTLLFQGAIRDFVAKYGDRYVVDVVTNFRDLWLGNKTPRSIFDIPQRGAPAPIEIRWRDAKHAQSKIGGKPAHILAWYHHAIAQALKVELSPLQPKGAFRFLPEEAPPLVEGPYVLLVAGGKTDISAKVWPREWWFKLVDRLLGEGISVVQGGCVRKGNTHFPLPGVINMVGTTEGGRDMMRLIRDATAVICGVTGPMHAAAIFDKPCVVLGGGREEPWFEAYDPHYDAFGSACSPIKVPHRFLHTLGQLNCCQSKGCWKYSVRQLEQPDFEKPERLCRQVTSMTDGQLVAECQRLITPDAAFDALASYWQDGTLPPPPWDVAIPVHPTANAQMEKRTKRQAAVLFANRAYPYEAELPMIVERTKRRYTLFVLCYGDYPQIAERCISSFTKHISRSRLDIRVMCNAVSDRTIEVLKQLSPDVIYVNRENEFKYPVMRRAFRDPQRPVETEWILWADDDVWVRDPKLFDKLDAAIDQRAPEVRAYGSVMYHDLQVYAKNGHDPRKWFQSAPWWKGRPLRLKGSKVHAPNGTCIDFPVGWFWAAHYPSLIEADIPDARLVGNGGDITIGAQLHQAGFKTVHFNPNKTIVACPSREGGGRRGPTTPFLWRTPE